MYHQTVSGEQSYEVCLWSRSAVLPPVFFSSRNIVHVRKACSACDKDRCWFCDCSDSTWPHFLLFFSFTWMGVISLVLWFLYSHRCQLGLSASMPRSICASVISALSSIQVKGKLDVFTSCLHSSSNAVFLVEGVFKQLFSYMAVLLNSELFFWQGLGNDRRGKPVKLSITVPDPQLVSIGHSGPSCGVVLAKWCKSTRTSNASPSPLRSALSRVTPVPFLWGSASAPCTSWVGEAGGWVATRRGELSHLHWSEISVTTLAGAGKGLPAVIRL